MSAYELWDSMIQIVWKSSDREDVVNSVTRTTPTSTRSRGPTSTSQSGNGNPHPAGSTLSLGQQIAIGVSIPIAFIAVMVIALWYFRRRRKRSRTQLVGTQRDQTSHGHQYSRYELGDRDRSELEVVNKAQEMQSNHIYEIDGRGRGQSASIQPNQVP